jgi:ubiquinone biosynthesis monooxygenase Coq7
MRQYSPADRFLIRLGEGLGAALPKGSADAAPAPASAGDATMAEAARQEAANLMRVNHAGEVAAQGLYQGQALTARDAATRAHLLAAAQEEQTHLQWCEARLRELGDRPSALRPFWYGASFAMGAAAGLLGDRWSLGFVAETERQVSEHLGEHIGKLPAEDARSREILAAMRADEMRHGREAEHRGGAPLPEPVRGLMRQMAKVMKKTAYRF